VINLGRGKSHLTFDTYTVTKRVANAWEPLFMRRFPEVFVEVQDVKHLSFTMARLREPDYNEPHVLLEASSLLNVLWGTEWTGSDKDWREKLRVHLHGLNILGPTEVDELIARLPDVVNTRLIHGDPTLANLLKGPKGYLWIDPLLRAYIPGDPHVDLGKMYQSCLGYEQVLLGNKPVVHEDLMYDLADLYALDHKLGMAWCAVHHIRLIPYQLERDRKTFENTLHSILRS
jgi:hypothetical protein